MAANDKALTAIRSNGSGPAQPIEALFAVLAEHPLDRTFEFEAFGSFITVDPVDIHDERYLPAGAVSFFGNFFDVSHVFHIDTTDADLIARLTAAIRANQQRPDYLAQETHEQQVARHAAEERARYEKRMEDEKRRARAVLGLEAHPHTGAR